MYPYPQYPQYGGYQPQQTYQPQQFQTIAQGAGMPQTQGIIKVTGIEGAKAYQMPPNSIAALFDLNDDILYIKTTDGAGFPTIETYDIVRRQQGGAATSEYATAQQVMAVSDEVDAVRQDLESVRRGLEQLKEALDG